MVLCGPDQKTLRRNSVITWCAHAVGRLEQAGLQARLHAVAGEAGALGLGIGLGIGLGLGLG